MEERKFFAHLTYEGTLVSDRSDFVGIEEVVAKDTEALRNCSSFTVQEGLEQEDGSLNYVQVSPRIYNGVVDYRSVGYNNSASKDGRRLRVAVCANGAVQVLNDNEIALGDNSIASLLSGIIGMQYTQAKKR